MGKRYRNLIDQIADPANIRLAYNKTAQGKRSSTGYLNFKEYEQRNLQLLRESILDRGYMPGQPRMFWINDPKPRPITALPFVDRVCQHAINNITFPIFRAGFLPNSYACIPGKGTHQCAIATQAMMRRMGNSSRKLWVLKTDFSKYFYSIPREVLWSQYESKISCQHTLWMLEQFHARTGTGNPIGALLSQGNANIIGTLADRYLIQDLKISSFIRYMDDIVVLHHSKAVLEGVKDFLEWFAQHRLRMHFSKWSIRPADEGVNFVGYRIFKNHKLLRKTSVRDAKRKIRDAVRAGDMEKLQKFVASWKGHIQWADSHNLKKYLNEIYLQEARQYASFKAAS